MALNGFSADKMKAGPSPVPYIVSILSSAFTAYTLAWVFIKIPVRSLLSGFLTGLLFGVVFVLFETIVKDMFSMRPLLLSLINGGASVVVYAMMGAVLGVWRKYE